MTNAKNDAVLKSLTAGRDEAVSEQSRLQTQLRNATAEVDRIGARLAELAEILAAYQAAFDLIAPHDPETVPEEPGEPEGSA